MSRNLPSNIKVERHHIMPKSMGGSNDLSNLAKLTLREHFICHLLLTKMTSGKHRNKMVYALWRMCHSRKVEYKVTSRAYATIKLSMASARTSDDFTPEWRAKISKSRIGKSAPNKGIPHSHESRQKMSISRKAKHAEHNPLYNIRPKCRPEKAAKISESNSGKKWIYNPTNSTERKQLDPDEYQSFLEVGWLPGIGQRKEIQKRQCPTCNNLIAPSNLSRHIKKCR